MRFIHIHSSLINQGNWQEANSYNHQLEGHSAVKVFYYVKAKDEAGSGYADISIKELAKIFDKSHSTVRRWLRFGIQLGFFRSKIKLKPGLYRIHYVAVNKVCLKHNIKNHGTITEVEVSELKYIKFRATEADAIAAQNKSLYAATKGDKKLIKNTLSAKKLCLKSQRILFLSDRFIYVNPSHLMYGASQKYIADKSGYSISTIQRRLDNKYRKSHGLLPVMKKQQCIRLDKEESTKSIVEQQEADFFGEKKEVIFHNNKFKDLAFKPYTNIYYIPEEDIQLRNQKYLRAKLNRAWAKIESQSISSANNQKQQSLGDNSHKNKLLIKNYSTHTLHQISKSLRIKLLDWVKELNFSRYKQEFKKVCNEYLVDTDNLGLIIDELLVSPEDYSQIIPPPKGRVL